MFLFTKPTLIQNVRNTNNDYRNQLIPFYSRNEQILEQILYTPNNIFIRQSYKYSCVLNVHVHLTLKNKIA